MTEVDTVMLEGGTTVPASPRQITSIAAESSVINEHSENNAITDTNVASNNVGTSPGSTTENNPIKITESTATSTTTIAATTETATTTTTTSSNGSVVKKTQNDMSSVTIDKLPTSTPMDVDEDDDCGGGAVTTTTTEQECEEDSQVTSSSADIDGHNDHDGNAHGNRDRDEVERSKQDSGEANLTPPPQPSDAVAENSNSQTVDGNDLVDGDAEADAETVAKSEIPASTEPEKDKEMEKETDKSLKNNEPETTNNINEISQSCDSVKKNDGADRTGAVVSKERSDIDENSISLEKNPKQSNTGVAIPESHIQTLSNEKSGVKQKAFKELSNTSPVDLVERINIDEDVDPLSMDNESSSIGNGVSKESTNNNNGAVVNLDDDSDDDNCDDEDDDNRVAAKSKKGEQSNGNKTVMKSISDSNKGKSAVCSDSDGAVVIGSDSENESTNISPSLVRNTKQQNPQPQPPAPITTNTVNESEDDDDDCVVIEDDSPVELTPKNDQIRRKSTMLDSENNSDDSQPPSKRQRRIGGGSQLTIKDARSLLPIELQSSQGNLSNVGNGKKIPNLNEGGVYPINITPAVGNIITQTGPPKLAPIGGITGASSLLSGSPVLPAVGSMPVPGLVGVNANANLLPGLTDDMFVLEAPSFIVPYIYEKPPSDSLKDIVKEIETKYELTKEDLTEADKSDEFDMITEQNKEDRELQQDGEASKKKKKKRFNADVDDSWSEESEDDDDDDEDDDSESGVRTKVLIKEVTDDLTALKGAIKPAAVVTQSMAPSSNPNAPAKPGQENYFESPLGKFFMDIGVGLVQEFVQTDLIRLQKRKMRKSLGKNLGDFERAITALSGNLEASKKKNSAFKFTMKRCEFCNFKSESALAMAHHYETPHMNGPLYKCNFCTFEIRNATEIVYHMEAMHNIKARLIKPLPYHQCPNCGFEDNGRAKLARHQPVCAKKFRPELNLAPPNDWEAPAKIPRIKPRHGLVGTATAYQAMAAQAAAQKAALATIQQQQQQQQARNLQAAALAAQNAAKIRGRPPVISKVGGVVGPNGTAAVLRGANPTGPRPMATNVVLPNNYQLPGNQIIPATNALHTGKKTSLPGQPSISITPLPRQSATPQSQAASPSTSKVPPAGIKPGRNAAGNKAQFVICEICDGYIKDLEQLRNHMQWMHEVKIHPKMIYNRPPLNCQKCQFRFFTDQGLERHLLGSHGLVTSSMQEAANKGKDAGRCPVCGRMYQWKLLNHVARDHHMTLKPAHLSYKCTVCTATFGMYKQFETHVYTAHSTVAKKAMDSKKNNAAGSASGAGLNAVANTGPGASAASSSGTVQRSGNLSTAANNDSLLKPLKINDEITIIPQPASKPRITNLESHVID